MINLYLADGPEILKRLAAAAEVKSSREFALAAHKFKSSSASVGALHLSSLLAEAERMGREDCREEFATVLAKITAEYQTVGKSLADEL